MPFECHAPVQTNQEVSGLLLPVAIDSRGRWRTASEVPRGRACGCRCPACQRPVIARQGEQRRAHFAHASRNDSPGTCSETALHRLCKEVICDSVRKCITLPGFTQYNVRIDRVRSEVNLDAVDRRVDLISDVSIESQRDRTFVGRCELVIEICVSNAKDHEYCMDMKRAGVRAIEITVDWGRVLERGAKTPTQARVSSAIRFLLLSMTGNKRWLHNNNMETCQYCGRYEVPNHTTNGVRCGLTPCPTCDGHMRQDSPYDSCFRCSRKS